MARSLVSLFVIALVASACSRADAPPQPAPATSPATDVASCPLGVAGARVEATDVPGGVAVRITGPSDRLEELRHRVHDAGQLDGIGAHLGLGHGGKHLGAQRHGLRLAELPPVTADVKDLDDGSEIDLTVKHPSQLDEMRSQLHERVALVNAGPCD